MQTINKSSHTEDYLKKKLQIMAQYKGIKQACDNQNDYAYGIRQKHNRDEISEILKYKFVE